jgi:hypothetical protein
VRLLVERGVSRFDHQRKDRGRFQPQIAFSGFHDQLEWYTWSSGNRVATRYGTKVAAGLEVSKTVTFGVVGAGLRWPLSPG